MAYKREGSSEPAEPDWNDSNESERIAFALKQLNAAADELSETVSQLEDQMAYVLRPEGPTEGEDKISFSPIEESRAPVVVDIYRTQATLHRTAAAIRNLQSRFRI